MSLKNRHLLRLLDFTPEEVTAYLSPTAELKTAEKVGREVQRMQGKDTALIFEKTSTRTRCAFEVAARDQGTGVTYLEPSTSQIGHKGSIKDTARVLGRMFDGIECRGLRQDVVGELAKHAGVPVFNDLASEFHPTQMLANALATREHSDKPLNRIVFTYVGDARYNTANPLLVLAAKPDVNARVSTPESLWPSENIIKTVQAVTKETGGQILLTENVKETVKGVDLIHIDVWVSVGEPKEAWQECIDLLKDYRVIPELTAAAENPQVKLMHCLPAFHNRETGADEWIHETFSLNGVEITEGAFENEVSIVFNQVGSRIRTIKAVMVTASDG